MRRMQRFDEAYRVRGSSEKIGIPESNVRSTSRDLRGDVGKDHVALYDAELPVVNRHDRAMAAQVPAAAARFGVADKPPIAVRHLQCRVLRQWRQRAAIGNE